MKALLSTTLVFASLMLSVATEARTLYWTGYGATPHAAVQDGSAGARRSCIQDYGIQPGVCWNAPIIQIDDYGVNLVGYDYYGNPVYQFMRRVYIAVP